MKNFITLKFYEIKIKLSLSKKVFQPNLTTTCLISAVKNIKIKKKIKVLDLGSGSGIIGIFVKKFFGKNVDIFFSDKSNHAVKMIENNLKINKIKGFVKQSDIFEKWEGHKFDLIINDISAIDENIANKLWYNRFIPHNCGDNGINLSKK